MSARPLTQFDVHVTNAPLTQLTAISFKAWGTCAVVAHELITTDAVILTWVTQAFVQFCRPTHQVLSLLSYNNSVETVLCTSSVDPLADI